jgi:hypothetical protein
MAEGCVGADTDAVNQTAGGVVAREVGEGGVWFVKRIHFEAPYFRLSTRFDPNQNP